MSRAKVSIVKAVDYGGAGVDAAVEEAVELVGGLEHVVKPGSVVFVKINHLSPASPPERGIITHPAFVEAVLKLLRRAGARVTVGDDIDSSSGDGFQVSGFRQMCRRAGVALVNLREVGFVETRCGGRFLEKVYVSRIAAGADVIVNLPKLKTHSLTVLTGGVKNMYGVIPGGLRTRFHGDYAAKEDFAQVLTDIFSAARPQLTIMDGVVAMEGEGPAAGKLRRLGVILASRDHRPRPHGYPHHQVRQREGAGSRPLAGYRGGRGAHRGRRCPRFQNTAERHCCAGGQGAALPGQFGVGSAFTQAEADRAAVYGMLRVCQDLPRGRHFGKGQDGGDRPRDMHTLYVLPRGLSIRRYRARLVAGGKRTALAHRYLEEDHSSFPVSAGSGGNVLRLDNAFDP